MKGDITLRKTNERGIIDIRNKVLALKNNAPFTNCISKINNVLIDNAEDLDIVMPMYNLLEYSKNYRKTTGSFWNYYRDEPNNPPLNDDDPPTINYNADPITNSESFKYKSSITGKTSNANQEKGKNTEQGNTKIKKSLENTVSSKYLSNIWRSLDMLLTNFEVSLTFTWSENCVLTNISTQTAQGDNVAKSVIFKIIDTKLYVPVVTLSTKDDNNFLEQLISGFKRTTKRKKCKSD